MANIPIRNIPLEGTPTGSAYLVFDDGQMKKGQVSSLADAVRPVASQGEAEAGVDNTKTMTPLRVDQAIASEVGVTLASKAQGDLANTALQPAAIGATIQAYDPDLQAIAALAPADDSFIQRKAGAWANRTVAQVRADLNDGQPYGPFGVSYSGNDLNVIEANGRYAGAGMINAPSAGWFVVDHMVQGNSPPTHATQIAYNMSDVSTQAMARSKSGGPWTSWAALGGSMDGYVPAFTTKAAAQAYNPNSGAPDAIRVLSQSGLAPNNGGQEWLGRKVASAPAHENYITIANGSIYERVPAAPASPASVTELGMVPGFGGDSTPFFNKVLTASKNSGFSRWYVPPGGYTFSTRPNDVDFEGFIFQGEQKSRTTFYKNFVSSGYLDATINLRRGYFQITDIEFISLLGSQLKISPENWVGVGAQLSVVCPNAATPIGYCTLERLNFTSDSTAKANAGAAEGTGATVERQIVFDGRAADGSTGAAIGIRQAFLNQVQTFGAETASASFINASGVQWIGGSATRAGGKKGRIIFDSVLGSPVQNCNLTLGAVSDGVGFSNARSCMVTAGVFEDGVITFDAASSYNFVMGAAIGVTKSDLGTNNRCYGPGFA